MIYAVNYANEKYRKAQKFNSKTAYKHGADKVYEFRPEDIDETFYLKHKQILDSPRGNGYWLWKPYFIQRVLNEMAEGDCLFYSDAGLYYLNDLPQFFDELSEKGQWMICQGTGYKEYQYTKRDVFVYMGLDEPEYVQSEQRNGIVALIKCDLAVKFVKEWLNYACDYRIISDAPNTCGKENYDGFVDNRHDQSIFSLLTKKYGISQGCLFEDITKRKTSKAPLCYHHTIYGGVASIILHQRFDPYWWKIKSIIKKILFCQ